MADDMSCPTCGAFRRAEDAADVALVAARRANEDPTKRVELDDLIDELGLTEREIEEATDG